MTKARLTAKRSAALLAGMLISALVSGPTAAQQAFPNKPLRLVTPPPGGGADFIARLIALGATPGLGQQLIVDNRPTNVIFEQVAQAAPDGYTLLMGGPPLWLRPLIEKTSFDAIRDFAPVSLVNASPSILVVHPSVDVKTVTEFIAYAKARPGALNFGSGGNASGDHLAVELFKSMAGINMTHVPYKGAGPAVAALIAGEIQFMMGSTPTVLPHIKAGKLRALAVTSPQPTELAPGIPPVATSGVPGYEFQSLNGVLAPAKTPPAIVNRISQEVVRAMTAPEVKQKVFGTGSEVIASTPEQFSARIKSEIAVWGKVIKDAGIKAE